MKPLIPSTVTLFAIASISMAQDLPDTDKVKSATIKIDHTQHCEVEFNCSPVDREAIQPHSLGSENDSKDSEAGEKSSPESSAPVTTPKPGKTQYFIHHDILFRVDDAGVKQLAKVDWDAFVSPEGMVSYVTKRKQISSHISPDDELSIFSKYSSGGSIVEVQRITPNGNLELVGRYEMPQGRLAKTTAISGGIVYATLHQADGGDNLWMIDTRKGNDAKATRVEVPAKVKHKPFDDLLVDGSQMIAVDNMVSPKWLVVYDLSDPALPKPQEPIEFDSGLNEHVMHGALGEKHLVLLAISIHQAGENISVSVYESRKNFSRKEQSILWSYDRLDRSSSGHAVNPAMSFMGDLLLLSNYREGVAVIDCNADKVKLQKLIYKSPEGKEMPVRDSFALPSRKQVVIWLQEDGVPLLATAGDLKTIDF